MTATTAPRTSVAHCTCIWDCSGHDRCSLSGDPHTHQADGPCPLHPDAPTS